MKTAYLKIVLILALLLVAVVPVVGAASGSANQIPDGIPPEGANNDNPSHPLGDQQNALRVQAVASQMNGKVNGPVAEVAKGQFVQLEREGEDSIWTVIAEFGPQDHPAQSFIRASLGRCTMKSPSQIAVWTTPQSGRRISPRPTMKTCFSRRLPALFPCAIFTSRSHQIVTR